MRYLILLLVFLTACVPKNPSAEAWASSLESYRNGGEQNWNFRGIHQYQMTVNVYSSNYCQQTIASENSISTLLEDTCNDGVIRDVNYLFDWIENRIVHYAENPGCGPNGCRCDGPLNLEVHYHRDYGYPMIIIERPFPEYRERPLLPIGTPQPCTEMGFMGENYYVTSFIPAEQ